MGFLTELERDGFAVVPSVVPNQEIESLLESIHALVAVRSDYELARIPLNRPPGTFSPTGGEGWDEGVRFIGSTIAAETDITTHHRGYQAYAIRNLLRVIPQVRQLVESAAVRSLVESVLGPNAFVVRDLFFDKTPDANWKVPWHQDLTIAVRHRKDVPGFGPWSVKDGVPHVVSPAEWLERMLTVRLHLDDCGEENGPLRVLPSSHRNGKLDPEAIQMWREKLPAVCCAVKRGDALLMRPLLLHASSPARRPGHRRVIHLEFASEELPGGLQWMA